VTSSALTGFVATTLLTDEDVWKDRLDGKRALDAADVDRAFLNINDIKGHDEKRNDRVHVLPVQFRAAILLSDSDTVPLRP